MEIENIVKENENVRNLFINDNLRGNIISSAKHRIIYLCKKRMIQKNKQTNNKTTDK